MCKEQETEQKQETTSTVPGFVTDASKKLVGAATGLVDKPFEAYGGERVAGFTPDQTLSFDMLRNYVAGAPDLGPEAIAGARTYANAPGQQISTERVVDEGGQLGMISDYLNPYVDAALQPAIREITDAAQRQRIQLGNMATSSGAYGDERHGVLESAINQDYNQAVGDTAKQFYMDAFDKAMGLRGQDLNRFYGADVAQANLNEQALGRGLTGTGQLLSREAQDQQNLLTQLGALLGHGTLQQSVDQAQLDSAYQEFLREYQNSFDVVAALNSALSGLPFDRTQTSTTTGTTPDNSLLGIGGAVLGAALAPVTGGASLAMVGPSLGFGAGGTVGPQVGAAPVAGSSDLPWLAA